MSLSLLVAIVVICTFASAKLSPRGRDVNMSEEQSMQSRVGIARQEPSTSIQDSMREWMGPLMADNAVRNAIQQCWTALPEAERSPERVEQEILRLVQRALRDLKEDAAAFGFVKADP